MIGHGLKLFVSDRDLRWAFRSSDKRVSDAELVEYVRVALRMFNVVPEQHPRSEEDVEITVERDEAMRGCEVTVAAPFLTTGFAKPLPLRLEPQIKAVEHDGRHFTITGELVPVPDETKS